MQAMPILGVVVAALSANAHAADSYPSRAIRMLVPYAVGGNADIMARAVSQRLTDRMGQQIVVDNRPGAAGMIATELAARSAPDGYTMVAISSSHTVNPSLLKKMPYDSLKDFAPVSQIGVTPMLVVAHPSVTAGTIKELIALAKAKPGQLNFGSNGNGSPANLAGLLLNSMSGITLTHVGYKGTAQATTDVLAGHIQLGFPSLTSVMPLVRTGKLKALAITTAKRSALAPDIPTVAESGVPGYQTSIWVGILLPSGTPAAIVDRVNRDVRHVLTSSDIPEKFAAMGADVLSNTPAEFTELMKAEIAKWNRLIRDTGLKVDLAG